MDNIFNFESDANSFYKTNFSEALCNKRNYKICKNQTILKFL